MPAPSATVAAKRRRGRPLKYRPQTADAVCARIAAGETLRAVCRDLGIPPSTVRQWHIDDIEGFAAQYARARQLQADHWADEIVEIADDGTGDEWVNDEGRKVVNHDHIQRSRLRVDTRKWLLSKLRPGKYGDRVAMEHSGPDGAPVQREVLRIPVHELSDEELEMIRRLLVRTALPAANIAASMRLRAP